MSEEPKVTEPEYGSPDGEEDKPDLPDATVEMPTDGKTVETAEVKQGVQEITADLGSVSFRRKSKSPSKKAEVKDKGKCYVGLSKVGWLATVSFQSRADPAYDYYEARLVQSVSVSETSEWYVAKRGGGKFFACPSHNNMKLHTGVGNPTLAVIATRL
eukprot:gb/GEZN01023997.1/.p1 GENE.gb/GEZN01023997.1/~~gb/GEZN01023997.1/.p1  ORF type:complete len:184 (-),score=19.56 gb/GEZN01023997.1/:29-502(-)